MCFFFRLLKYSNLENVFLRYCIILHYGKIKFEIIKPVVFRAILFAHLFMIICSNITSPLTCRFSDPTCISFIV